MTLTDRYKKGLEIADKAIQTSDAALLRECLMQFKKINAPSDILQEAIGNCPFDLIKQADVIIEIQSGILGRNISLGSEISWEEIALLKEKRITGKDLRKVIEAKSLFSGEITEVVEKSIQETEDMNDDEF